MPLVLTCCLFVKILLYCINKKIGLSMTEDIKDGIYRNDAGVFFVKDNLIIARIRGVCYKMSSRFWYGAKYETELTDKMRETFETAYQSAPNW